MFLRSTLAFRLSSLLLVDGCCQLSGKSPGGFVFWPECEGRCRGAGSHFRLFLLELELDIELELDLGLELDIELELDLKLELDLELELDRELEAVLRGVGYATLFGG